MIIFIFIIRNNAQIKREREREREPSRVKKNYKDYTRNKKKIYLPKKTYLSINLQIKLYENLLLLQL